MTKWRSEALCCVVLCCVGGFGDVFVWRCEREREKQRERKILVCFGFCFFVLLFVCLLLVSISKKYCSFIGNVNGRREISILVYLILDKLDT